MALTIIFLLSGLSIATLVLVKIQALKTKRAPLLLDFISSGDHHVREIYQNMTHRYSDLKEKGNVLITKQLPMHTKNLLNKTENLVKEKSEKYIGNIRNTRLLNNRKKGISEFFKNLSDKENADSQNDSSDVK